VRSLLVIHYLYCQKQQSFLLSSCFCCSCLRSASVVLTKVELDFDLVLEMLFVDSFVDLQLIDELLFGSVVQLVDLCCYCLEVVWVDNCFHDVVHMEMDQIRCCIGYAMVQHP